MLQYAHSGERGVFDLVIGLDFGTSSSKVVIQAPHLAGSQAYAVDFGRLAHESMKYLLPTKLWIMPDGTCHLDSQDGATEVRDIKLELLSRNDHLRGNHGPTHHGLSAESAAVVYLALLLRYVRRWFLETRRDIVGDFSKLIWSMNLGVPSPCIEENDEKHRFERVGKAAWMLSVLCSEATCDRATEQLVSLAENPDDWDLDDGGVTCDFDLIPEIAAGAVGYARSDVRRQGLHIMIDVGASTVDVCGFILRHDEVGYSLLVADVQQLGTIKLYLTRVRAIEKAFPAQAQGLLDRYDPLEPIPESIDFYLRSEDQLQAEVESAEEKLAFSCRKMMRRVIHKIRLHRAIYEDAWYGQLPILLIGGGSKVPFFKTIVEGLHSWTQEYCRNEGIALHEVPVPEMLKVDTDDYHRLAVAWGLSHSAPNIGDIIPADRIDDMDPPPRRPPENLVGPEQT